jgi:hypothetical protein
MMEVAAPSPHCFLHKAHPIQIPLPMIYSPKQSPPLDFSKLAAILLETEGEHPHNHPLVQILIFVRSRFAAHGRPSYQRTILYFFTHKNNLYDEKKKKNRITYFLEITYYCFSFFLN